MVAGSIYAYSSRLFKVNDQILPYAWNHTITYDAEYGKMPFLVQRLSAQDLYVEFDVSDDILRYQLTASIAKGENTYFECPFLNPLKHSASFQKSFHN